MNIKAWMRNLLVLMAASKPDPNKIDFFIVGAQKSATTALVEYLRRHRAVQIATIKEIHFFDNETIDWAHPDYGGIESHFDWVDPAIMVRGEATPIYMYWPEALQRLHRYSSRAKIIMCLRHPAYRAHSQWRMETVHQDETLSFEDAISDAGRRRVRDAPGGVHRNFSYIERGFYAGQVRRVQALFPRRQILYIRTDDLWLKTQATIDAVQDFLGVPRVLAVESEYIVPTFAAGLGGIPPGALARLTHLFANDVAETARLTGLSLAEWLDADYREPMIVSAR